MIPACVGSLQKSDWFEMEKKWQAVWTSCLSAGATYNKTSYRNQPAHLPWVMMLLFSWQYSKLANSCIITFLRFNTKWWWTLKRITPIFTTCASVALVCNYKRLHCLVILLHISIHEGHFVTVNGITDRQIIFGYPNMMSKLAPLNMMC